MRTRAEAFTAKFFGAFVLTPLILLFIAVIAIFPFISTVIGASLKIGGMEIWKYLWLLWLGALLGHIFLSRGFFDRWGGRVETALWVFIAFMLAFSPVGDLAIDPWKNLFFCILTIVMFRFFAVASAGEIWTMVKSALGLWWAYALVLMVYAKSYPDYPGSIQHQFFLSGLLGFVVGMLLLLRSAPPAPGTQTGRGLYWLLLATVIVNVILNLTITEARSVFPFSLALGIIAVAWLLRPTKSASRIALRFGLPLAFLFILLPLLHLSGAMGNLVNELAYPIFGKLRTVESKTGREVAFWIWKDFVVENARVLGPIEKPMPAINQEDDEHGKPLFGMSQDQFAALKKQGVQSQAFFLERQHKLGVEVNRQVQQVTQGVQSVSSVPTINTSLAITSSHNLWLDAAARGGLLYAAAIALAFSYVVWLILARLAPDLPAPLAFAYWAMAVSWGIASQFDDEHWLYHIPYLTLFFIPVMAFVIRGCAEQVVHAPGDAPC